MRKFGAFAVSVAMLKNPFAGERRFLWVPEIEAGWGAIVAVAGLIVGLLTATVALGYAMGGRL